MTHLEVVGCIDTFVVGKMLSFRICSAEYERPLSFISIYKPLAAVAEIRLIHINLSIWRLSSNHRFFVQSFDKIRSRNNSKPIPTSSRVLRFYQSMIL